MQFIQSTQQWNLIQVDSFTRVPFAGNPAAVCLVTGNPDDRWLQNVAREMNLSETAFLTIARGGTGYNLRWFTPTTEVELCGHATLASAHVLWEEEYLQPDEVARFQTLSGELTARRDGEWIEMDFPLTPVLSQELHPDLLEGLGVLESAVNFVGKTRFDYFLELASEDLIRGLQPDFARLATVPGRGVIVTSRASKTGEYDFVSRVFGPAVGINEDPVTGSAHCGLAPYWSEKLGKDSLVGYQASERGGIVRVRPQGERVLLGGQAVTVLRGTLAR
jgi:PhzF family phenazine biosynthesis protein